MTIAIAICVWQVAHQTIKVGDEFKASVIRVISPTKFVVLTAAEGKETEHKVVVRLYGLMNPTSPTHYREALADVRGDYVRPLREIYHTFKVLAIDKNKTLATTITGEIYEHIDEGYRSYDYSVGESYLKVGVVKLNPKEPGSIHGYREAEFAARKAGRGLWKSDAPQASARQTKGT